MSAALMTAPAPSTVAEELAWSALEAEFAETWRWVSRPVPVAPKFSNRPHPRSYGAALPMRTVFASNGYPRIEPLTPAEKRYLAAREAKPAGPTLVRANAPHPLSECAHLPMRSSLRGHYITATLPPSAFKLTPAEAALVEARPLRYTRAA
jgi:hypothetical protein